VSDRTTVRIDVISHSTLEIIKAKTGETPSRIIRRLIFEGKLADVAQTGITKHSITVRMDFSTREHMDAMKKKYSIDASEIIRRLLWNQALSSNEFGLQSTESLTNAIAASKAFDYVSALRQTAKKYRELAAISAPEGQYFHEASVKAALLEKQCEDWFAELGRYLHNEATNGVHSKSGV
jgi:hypothetical protein